ncbi:PhoU domain-containing protein, partial [Gemelliphila palaticanis]
DMIAMARKSFDNAVNFFQTRDEKLNERGNKLEEAINSIDEEMANYLTLLFREKLSNKEGVVASALLDGTRDIERVGDHARDMLVS